MEGKLYTLDPERDILLVVNGSPNDDVGMGTQASSSANQERNTATARTLHGTPRPDTLNIGQTSNLEDIIHEIDGTKIRVSSKHLTLASQVFHARLSSSQPEGAALKAIGYAVMAIACSNVEALLIVLHALHSQIQQLPRQISLDVLRDIAILVDSYKLHNAVGAFLGHWISKLAHTIPNGGASELMSWSWISKISNNQLLRRATAELALRISSGPLSLQNLPMADGLKNKLENGRQDLISRVIQSLKDRLEKLQSGTQCCTQCTEINQASLLHQLQTAGLYPLPTPPYLGVSYRSLQRTLLSFEAPNCRERVHPFDIAALNCLFLPGTWSVFAEVRKDFKS